MSVALDTNILVSLLASNGNVSPRVADVLEDLGRTSALVLSPVVYAEVLAGPGRVPADVEDLITAARIRIAWDVPPSVWIEASKAYAAYGERRRRSGGGATRRILADFLIGAHARDLGDLLTFDTEFYQINFPELRVLSP